MRNLLWLWTEKKIIILQNYDTLLERKRTKYIRESVPIDAKLMHLIVTIAFC